MGAQCPSVVCFTLCAGRVDIRSDYNQLNWIDMEHVVAAPDILSVDPIPEKESRLSNTFLRLKKHLERKVGEAIGDYGMIADGMW
jgi:hypothetical protein